MSAVQPSAMERFKYGARVRAGAVLHALGAYRLLLPVFLPHPTGALRRLQAYLMHYYHQAESADAEMHLDGLGLTVACDIKDHMLWYHLQGLTTVYEQIDIDHCRALVRPGDHILDVGANHGFWGFSLGQKAGGNAVVYLCEPNPTLQRRILRTAQRNPGIDARLLPYAIADGTQRELTFYLPHGNLSGLGSTVLHASARDRGWLSEQHRTTVPARSIDALVAEGAIARIDLMKIDVEHAEDGVVRGALEALRRFRPRLLMVETSPGSTAARTLRDLGYDNIYRLDGEARPAAVEQDYWGNIFFAREHA